jgi:hypothetical protein
MPIQIWERTATGPGFSVPNLLLQERQQSTQLSQMTAQCLLEPNVFPNAKEILEQRPRNSVKKWDQLRAIGFSSFNVVFLLWRVSRCGCGDGVYTTLGTRCWHVQ